MASRAREMNARGREIAAGWDAMDARRDGLDARPDEIDARFAATNAGCAEKLGLRGRSRSAENACTPKSLPPKTPSGA